MIRFSPRTATLLAIISVAGLMMFAWPLLLHGYERVQPPFVFLALLPLMLVVLLSELSAGGIDTRMIALLGVLSAIEAVLRAVSAGTGGVELVFFMLILGGRVFGPAFGFVLGCTSLFVAALVTAGVGPWLPYQMLGAAWVAMGAGLLPRASGRWEVAMLAAYGIVASYAYGLLLNLQGWPLLTGVTVPGASGNLSYDPTAGLAENLVTFLRYTLVTSTSSWDTMRAITTAVAVALLGPAVLATLRRAARRARITTPTATEASPLPAE
ncbi:energy-coupling factor transport system substrate-specific component [Nocardioides albertanoniae]|uniref:Energy-coupling factor transport system substrate-specific component n=1 Tax=Nocardioides albertanoniae TaxID=1175486 RepID=A0A543AAI7_9ACTN|nr:ECF transporter S component [Nocardioides albertanoniae]TQL69530.1 energy-coupling factor transport system substrate-specific component [Nocardioides albertanoniae]